MHRATASRTTKSKRNAESAVISPNDRVLDVIDQRIAALIDRSGQIEGKLDLIEQKSPRSKSRQSLSQKSSQIDSPSGSRRSAEIDIGALFAQIQDLTASVEEIRAQQARTNAQFREICKYLKKNPIPVPGDSGDE
jgi:chromosome segregation ATPase